jgi:hypothetical protein
LLVIHDVGGVGKSSLLRMFRLYCKSVDVPVALASGDEAKSAFDVLARWTDDLKADGVAFPAFGKTFEYHREIQAKVDAQAKKAGGRPADIASKAASKTAEAAPMPPDSGHGNRLCYWPDNICVYTMSRPVDETRRRADRSLTGRSARC